MSKIFKPRRGKASTMLGTKSSTVLAAGEMFIELPDTGVGTGICKMKMGDGVTSYGQLPYAMGGDIASTEITGSITEDTSSSAEAAIANVTTGKTLGAIIGSLRRACDLNQKAIKTLNDDTNYFLKSTHYKNIQLGTALTGSDNLNNLRTPGYYFYIDYNVPSNTPSTDSNNSVLFVLPVIGRYYFQVNFCYNKRAIHWRVVFSNNTTSPSNWFLLQQS